VQKTFTNFTTNFPDDLPEDLINAVEMCKTNADVKQVRMAIQQSKN
jgi:hypothetical protein